MLQAESIYILLDLAFDNFRLHYQLLIVKPTKFGFALIISKNMLQSCVYTRQLALYPLKVYLTKLFSSAY